MGASTPLAYPFLEGLRVIGVGKTQGHELAASGELKTFMVGCRRFISHAAAEEFVAQREQAEAALRGTVAEAAAKPATTKKPRKAA